MIFTLLDKLRNKPDHIKKHIAFLFAFSISGLIFVIWLSVIYPDWRTGQNNNAKVASNEPSPISTITDAFSSVFGSVGGQISDVKNKVSSLLSTSSSYYVANSVNSTNSTNSIIATSTNSIIATSTTDVINSVATSTKTQNTNVEFISTTTEVQ